MDFLQHLVSNQTFHTAATVGSILGVVWFFFNKTSDMLKRQLTNGDQRSIRMAVDDLAEDFREHRHEIRGEIREIKDRLSDVEKGHSTNG